MSDLEKRIQALEDIEAIKNLKASYCNWADAGIGGDSSKMDELLARFTDDARADFGPFGVYEGKAAITPFFKVTVPGIINYSSHMLANPIIEVNGNTGKGTWYVHVPCTMRASNRAGWIAARYEEEYVKEKGRWMWKTMKATFDYFTPFDEGWVKTPMANG